MPRKVITLGLVSLLILQAGRVFPQTNDAHTIEGVLRDLSVEVERFATNMAAADWDWSQRTEEEIEVARLRARIRNLRAGMEIAVVALGGQRFEGDLESAEPTEFALWINQGSRSHKFLKHLRYEDIESAVLPKWNGWTSIDELQNIEEGKRVEVLLVDERKINGRFSSATTEVLALELGKGQRQEVSLDEVAGVRTKGLRRGDKIAIACGAILGGLVLATIAALHASG